MHGLAQLEHHVVGDVHHWVDASKARATEPLRHPVRGRTGNVHALEDPAEVAGAGLRGRDRHREGIVDGGRHRGAGLGAELNAIEHGQLPGKASHGKAIAPIRRQVDIKDRIV